MKKIKEIEKEFVFELKSKTEVNVSLRAIYTYDPSYGSDADGNRGIGVWLLEDFETKILNDVPLSKEDEEELDALIEEKIDEMD
jgi:hypothetical protein